MSQKRRAKSFLNGWFWDRLEPFGAISAWPGSARLGSVRLGPARPRSARLGPARPRSVSAQLRSGRPGPARRGLGIFVDILSPPPEGGIP